MKKTLLDGTGLNISQIALGTDNFGVNPDEEGSRYLLDLYLDMGGNLIDTALIYSDWNEGEKSRSEKLIGRWLSGKRREDVVISTKGAFPALDRMDVPRLSPEEIESDIDKSLKNLGCDYIDIYWLHRDSKAMPVSLIAETLDRLVKKGKTRYFGVSNWSAKRVEMARKYAKDHRIQEISASQIQYSIAKPIKEVIDPTLVVMDEEEYDYYKETKVPVFAFSSQAKGFFSKLEKGGVESLSDKARQRYLTRENLSMYERLKKISDGYNISVGQCAIAALLCNKDFQTIPVVGCKNGQQVKDTLAGADVKLTTEDMRYILNE